MYVRSNTELYSCNPCCREKAISVTYCECVFVALVIQHESGMRRVVCHLWPVLLYYIFPHYLINAMFLEEKCYLT